MYYRLTYLLQLFAIPSFIAFVSLTLIVFNLLPSSLLSFSKLLVVIFTIIGALLAISYTRTRNFFALSLVFLAYWLTHYQVQLPALTYTLPTLSIDTPLSYLMISLLLPILLTINSLWAERFHLLQDLLLRFLILGGLLLVFYAVALSYPIQLNDALSTTYFPIIYLPHLGLAQIPQLAFLLCLVILLIQLTRNPQAYFAAQLIALAVIMLTLQWFRLPQALPLITLSAILMLSLAVLQEAFQMAFRDDLTGLPGRRALNERLQRLGRNYSLAMSDVDHFKKFNDTYGHDIGDQVLKMVATQLSKVGGGGRAYRYGGEEFTLVFPGKTALQAEPYIEKLRIAIENYKVKIRDESNRPSNTKAAKAKRNNLKSDEVSVTISMGIAERTNELPTPEDVIKAADQALYKAKGAGRNQTAVYK